MVDSLENNLSLSGVGSASGGVYGSVKVEGLGTVHGDLECIDCQIDGVATINGAVKAKRVQIRGKSKIFGSVEAEQVLIEGHVLIDGDVVATEKVIARGHVRIQGACDAERFQSDGIVRIDGLLNAEQIDIQLEGTSFIQNVGCARMNVDARRRGFWHRPQLDVHLIEGDNIHLACTKAQSVEGNTVTLERGCHIERVVYHSEFNIDKNAVAATVVNR